MNYSAQRAPRVLAGKFALGRVLGNGSMGTVYEAENLLIGRRVAVKVLRSGLARDPAQSTLFLSEARTTARVSHPNVVEILDIGLDRSGVPFIVMEYLEGKTLEQVAANRGPLPVAHACHLVAQVLAAVGAAHRANVVHRDLKPANILVIDPDGGSVVKLLDFGIAEGLVEHESLGCAGTPLYMAPEQALGRPVDGRSDLFSAAAILYELLSGSPPFAYATEEQILRATLAGRFLPLDERAPHVPAPLVAGIHAALSADPNRRPPSANAFQALVASYADGTGVSRVRPVGLRGGGPALAAPVDAESLPCAGRATAPRWGGTAVGIAVGFTLGAAALWWLAL